LDGKRAVDADEVTGGDVGEDDRGAAAELPHGGPVEEGAPKLRLEGRGPLGLAGAASLWSP
jgi:hypothetical protein